jgi:Tetracyclin repressor-like, C-terminal domain
MEGLLRAAEAAEVGDDEPHCVTRIGVAWDSVSVLSEQGGARRSARGTVCSRVGAASHDGLSKTRSRRSRCPISSTRQSIRFSISIGVLRRSKRFLSRPPSRQGWRNVSGCCTTPWASRLMSLFEQRGAEAGPEDLSVAAETAVGIFRGLLPLITSSKGRKRSRAIRELKTVLEVSRTNPGSAAGGSPARAAKIRTRWREPLNDRLVVTTRRR